MSQSSMWSFLQKKNGDAVVPPPQPTTSTLTKSPTKKKAAPKSKSTDKNNSNKKKINNKSKKEEEEEEEEEQEQEQEEDVEEEVKEDKIKEEEEEEEEEEEQPKYTRLRKRKTMDIEDEDEDEEREKEKEQTKVEKKLNDDNDIEIQVFKPKSPAKSNNSNNTSSNKSSSGVDVFALMRQQKQTTTNTTSSSNKKSNEPKSPVKELKKQKVDLIESKSTATITTTTTSTTKQVKKEVKQEIVDEQKEEEEEEQQEEGEEEEEEEEEVDEKIVTSNVLDSLIDDIEDEDEEQSEGEYDEEGEEEQDEEEEEKPKKKNVFQRKEPVSKKKGNAKTIQADLKVLSQYHPIKDACWERGKSLPYMVLAKTFEKIESTSSRLTIIEHLTNLFRSILILGTTQDLITTIYLSINKIGPSYLGKELGIGDKVLISAISESTGRSLQFVKQELKKVGDLGIIAQNSRMTQKVMFQPPPLTNESVLAKFKQIADLSGNASQKKKTELIKSLLIACKDCETLYIIRSLQGKLRIGLAERSVLLALSKAILCTPYSSEYPPKILDIRKTIKVEEFEERLLDAVAKVTRAYSQLPNYDLMIPMLVKENGLSSILQDCSLSVGVPVKPMLAQPTTGISQMLDRFTDMEFTCEFKYDGERAQIHCVEGGKITIYTRNLEDYTGKYPDIVQNVVKFIGPNVKSFILDCEAVGYDPATNKILSFQMFSSRPKKNVTMDKIKIPACVFAFDLLYLNGKSLIDEPFIKRREVLYANFIESAGVFSFAKYSNISDVNDIQAYLEEAVEGNCEGLMVKTLKEKSIYEPSRRSYNWLKIKKDYLQGMTDSLDLVPIGAWYGKGKRTGTYGAYLLACYDEDNEEFQTCCKIGTGFSDEQLTSFTSTLKPHLINQPRNMFRVNDGIKPDVWFNPCQVWEVLAADLSISPIHTAATGAVDPNKGIALRFPRFIRIREDKNPEDATSSDQVVDMYKNQKN